MKKICFRDFVFFNQALIYFESLPKCTSSGDGPEDVISRDPSYKEQVKRIGKQRKVKGGELMDSLYERAKALGFSEFLFKPRWKVDTYSEEALRAISWQERFKEDDRERKAFEKQHGELTLFEYLVKYQIAESYLRSTDEIFKSTRIGDVLSEHGTIASEGVSGRFDSQMGYYLTWGKARFEYIDGRLRDFITTYKSYPDKEQDVRRASELLEKLYESRLDTLRFYRQAGEIEPNIFYSDSMIKASKDDLAEEFEYMGERLESMHHLLGDR